jgi:hypothetical protein
MPLRARDFESRASASFATPAQSHCFLTKNVAGAPCVCTIATTAGRFAPAVVSAGAAENRPPVSPRRRNKNLSYQRTFIPVKEELIPIKTLIPDNIWVAPIPAIPKPKFQCTPWVRGPGTPGSNGTASKRRSHFNSRESGPLKDWHRFVGVPS